MTALMGIATRLKLARLALLVPDAPGVGDLATAAFAGGADAVIFAEDLAQDVSDDSAVDGVDDIREAARPSQGLVGYLGRPVRGAQLGPDLLVLADDEADAARARALVGEYTMLGRRCNSADEVDAALADETVDFLLVGPGLAHVRHAVQAAPAHDPASKPWFATGGITPGTLDTVLEAGARRVALDRAFLDTDDVARDTGTIKDRLRGSWADDPRMEQVTASAFGPSDNLTFRTGIVPGPTGLTL